MPGMGIAIVLLIGYVVTVAKHGATDVTAYKRGKEAPSIEKFRTRHREKADKGKRKLTAPAKTGGKEPGPVRQWARAVADNAAAEMIERQNTKSAARRKWYEQNAPQREEQWKQKWQAKLDKREAKIKQWGQRKGVIDPAPPTQVDAEPAQPAQPEKAETEKQRSPEEVVQAYRDAVNRGETDLNIATAAEWNSLTDDTRQQLIKEARNAGTTPVEASKDGNVTPFRANTGKRSDRGPAFAFRTTSNISGGTVYEQAATELRDSAEEVRIYCQDLSQFADALGGRGYGNEITGQAAELEQTLAPAGDAYADLAEAVQQQGDDMRDAYDQTNNQIPDDAAMAN